MAAPKSTKQEAPFEELYKQLEQKVALLEQGGLSLDDSLSTYEEAVALAQRCQQMLDGAELRITRLRESMAVGETPAMYDPGDVESEDEEPEP
jgi:exodeoxyribonuclease VII small subunit